MPVDELKQTLTIATMNAEAGKRRDDTLKQHTELLRDIHDAVFGNGKPENGLKFRVLWLENRISTVPTWQWMIEKTLLPLLFAIVGILIGHFMSAP